MIPDKLRDMAESCTASIFDEVTDRLEKILHELMEMEDGHFAYSRLFVAADITALLEKIG